MTVKIIGIIIGLLVFAAGLYYHAQEKDDPQSRKIYTIAAVAGGVLAAVCALLLFL